MDTSEDFVKNALADKSSYILNAQNKNGFYQFEYKIEKSEAVKNLELLEKGLVEIPKWMVFIACSIMIFALAFFAASLNVMANRKPEVGHLQSCADRPCASSLNLKCINKTCQCVSPQYYQKKCVDLSKYGEYCIFNSNCDPSQSLSCVGSKCVCALTKYWDSSSSMCMDKLNFGDPCNGDQCRINVNLICSSSGSCACLDDQLYYWSNTDAACLQKKMYSQSCLSSNECLNSQLTICKNGNCLCDNLKYFDGFNCVDRLAEFESCQTSSDMCITPMYCDTTEGCKCYGYYYFNPSLDTCVEMHATQVGPCSSHHHCRSDLNLECDFINNKCDCISGYSWSVSQSACKKTYTGSCSVNSDCNLDESLICLKSTSNLCNCPESSILNRCDCIRTTTSEKYWNSIESKCVDAKTYLSECASDYECKTKIEKTKCLNEKCDCEVPGGWKASTNQCKKCDANDEYNGELCYYFSTYSRDFDDIDDNDCDDIKPSSYKAILARVTDQQVLDFLVTNAPDDDKYWINSKRKDGGDWYSFLGSSVAVSSSLCSGYNAGREEGLYLDIDSGCYKSDIDDDVSLKFICEY